MFLVIVLGMRRGPLGERGGTRAGKGKKKKKNNGLGVEGRRRKNGIFSYFLQVILTYIQTQPLRWGVFPKEC